MTALDMRGAGSATAAAVLVVSDHQGTGRALTTALGLQGYDVLWATGVTEATELASWECPQLVLVHGGIGRQADAELIRTLRTTVPSAVIALLSPPCPDSWMIQLLDAGADDCIVGPIGRQVLVARIRAHLRRACGRAESPRTLAQGALVLDRPARRALVEGREVPLRPKEFAVLHHLVQNRGRVVSHRELVGAVWGADATLTRKAVNVQIHALRRKLAQYGPAPGRIVTLRGHGYRYDGPDEIALAGGASTSHAALRPVPTGSSPAGPPRG